ncbi:hypothetical protein E4U44_008570, partial [Claviceps purpurea]
ISSPLVFKLLAMPNPTTSKKSPNIQAGTFLMACHPALQQHVPRHECQKTTRLVQKRPRPPSTARSIN